MSFDIETTVDGSLLRVVIVGDGDARNAPAIVTRVEAAIRSSAARKVLVDVRGVRGRLGVGDTYFLVRSYGTDTHHLPVAVIDLAENRDHTTFHETAAVNAGYDLRFFIAEKDALAWLETRG